MADDHRRRRGWLPLYIALATTLDLLGVLGFGLSSASQSDIAANRRAADAGIITNRRLLAVACENTAQIARIEHTTVKQQAQQTALLVKSGITFGIPKAQFTRLVAQSQAQRAQYLKSLDDLAHANCTKLTGSPR